MIYEHRVLVNDELSLDGLGYILIMSQVVYGANPCKECKRGQSNLTVSKPFNKLIF